MDGKNLGRLERVDLRKSRIYIREDADFRKQELWSGQHEWLQANLESFHKIFSPIAREL